MINSEYGAEARLQVFKFAGWWRWYCPCCIHAFAWTDCWRDAFDAAYEHAGHHATYAAVGTR